MARYLITGAAGFIGSNLAEALLGQGEKVRGLDDFSTGKRENVKAAGDYELIEGDIRDPKTCRTACDRVDFVLHHAALGSVPLSVSDPALANDANVSGTLNMLIAARDAGVRRFVFAASSAAYGDTDAPAMQESVLPRPLSPYAVSKIAGEQYCRVFTDAYGLETVSLRYFNVYGRRQDPAGAYAAVIPCFVSALLRGEAARIYGDGEQSRDFVFIADVVQANLKACQAPFAACGRAFNIASGERTSLNELYRELAGLLGVAIEPEFRPERAGDVRHSLADIALAREVLGYTPVHDLAAGLAETIDWYRETLA